MSGFSQKGYGYELVLDLHGCDTSIFNRNSIDQFFTELCELIMMEKCQVHFWDDVGVALEERQTETHAKATTSYSIILTSTNVIHTLYLLESAYGNKYS